ncbi:MAG: YebC/PmpR family DNA-binding transcriptional regulator [Thermotogae bacterium]|nr:YebC/PmpR family DNA-binding transcriptional regulator [Thermotogota bacterium]
MAGHSKWAQIKHKKARVDARRSKIFNKLIREIQVAARLGGGNPDTNPRLRLAIEKAKEANMPWENIEKAIKRGTGQLEGVQYEEVVYEGYGPGGVAFMVKATTDNRNRTTSELRHIFSKYGGNLASPGSVAWQFKEMGVIYVEKSAVDEDSIYEVALEGGAEDVKEEEDTWMILTSPTDFSDVKRTIEEAGLPISSAQVTMLPQNTVRIEGKTAESVLKLYQALEDHDDVQQVYANFDVDVSVLEKAL